jgi:hypothetical protein
VNGSYARLIRRVSGGGCAPALAARRLDLRETVAALLSEGVARAVTLRQLRGEGGAPLLHAHARDALGPERVEAVLVRRKERVALGDRFGRLGRSVAGRVVSVASGERREETNHRARLREALPILVRTVPREFVSHRNPSGSAIVLGEEVERLPVRRPQPTSRKTLVASETDDFLRTSLEIMSLLKIQSGAALRVLR